MTIQMQRHHFGVKLAHLQQVMMYRRLRVASGKLDKQQM